MQTKYLSVLIHIKIKGGLARRKTGLSPPVKYFTDRSLLLLGIFYVFLFVFAMPLCASV